MPARKTVELKVIKGILFKRCPRCNSFVEMTQFHKKTSNPNNKQSYCNKCDTEYHREWSHKE